MNTESNPPLTPPRRGTISPEANQEQTHDNGITRLDPCEPGIRAHACIKHIPAWGTDDPRMEALRAAMQEGATVPALLMTARREIVCIDSLNRWRAAMALQLDTVPVQFVADDQVATTALALLHRRHFTKSALAYLCYPLMERAHNEARQRRLENLRNWQKGQCLPESARSALSRNTAEDFAEFIGIGRRLFALAAYVHKEFASPVKYDIQIQGGRHDGAIREQTLKEHFEPRILAEMYGDEHEQHRPMGLGAVARGIGSLKSEAVANQKRPEQLDLFTNAVDRLSHCLSKLDSAAVKTGINSWFEKHEDPDELERLQRLGEMIAAGARKRCRELESGARGGAK